MPETLSDNFSFERQLRFLTPYCTQVQIAVLQKWKSANDKYQMEWERYSTLADAGNQQAVIVQSQRLFNVENAVINTLSQMYLETPQPELATGLWDAGKEQQLRRSREDAIIAIKHEVDQGYQIACEHLPLIYSPSYSGGVLEDVLEAAPERTGTVASQADISAANQPMQLGRELAHEEVYAHKELQTGQSIALIDALLDDELYAQDVLP